MSKKKSGKAKQKEKSVISEEFEFSVRLVREAMLKSGIPKNSDFTGPVLTRRKAAVAAYQEEVQQRYAESCPHLRLDREWAVLCSTPGDTIDSLDHIHYISLASAIWLLDTLSRSGRIREAAPFIPEEEVDPAELPEDFFDPCHDKSLLRRMLYLVINRDERKDEFRWSINETAARRREPVSHEPPADTEHLTNRQRFEAIMTLVHPVYKERAVRRFEESVWEFVGIYFQQADRYAERERYHLDKSERISEELTALDRGMGNTDVPKITKRSPFLSVSPPANPVKPALFVTPASDFTFRDERPVQRASLYEMGKAEIKEMGEWMCKRTDLRIWAPLSPIMGEQVLREETDREAASALKTFTVGDPFEICFAFLCLLETGSDLPWLYTPAMAVLLAACAKLPWDKEELKAATEDVLEEEWDNNWAEEMEEESADLEPLPEVEEPDWEKLSPVDWHEKKSQLYSLDYTDLVMYRPFEPDKPLKRMNLPQLVYQLTGLVMPRTVSDHDGLGEDLAKSGVPLAEGRAWEHYFQLVTEVRPLNRLIEHHRSRRSRAEEMMDAMGDMKNEAMEGQEKQIRVLEGQLAELRGQLHAANRRAEDGQAELERMRQMTANERRELADLRELVFNRSSGQEEDVPKRETVQLPYETRRRTVVFGGHDTWLKAIRTMLPDVTFVDKGARPNAEMVRRADVVWIQANALAHKHYYKIIDIVRTYRIPVRYFGYASAEKCAAQLAIADRESKD